MSGAVSRPAAHGQLVRSFAEARGQLGGAISAARRGNAITIHPGLQQAARDHLAELDPLFRPAEMRLAILWLGKLAPAVLNAPLSPQEIASKGEALWELCAQLPRGVWCDETRFEWLRDPERGKFWPGAGEAYNLLAAFAGRMSVDRAGCQAILATASTDGELPVRSEAEKQAVALMVGAWRQEQEAKRQVEAAAAGKPPVRAFLLSDADLIRTYEPLAAAGDRIAQLRLEGLRRKMGAAAAPAPANVNAAPAGEAWDDFG